MTWWQWWRGRQVEQAREALERSRRERPAVERLVHDLRARKQANHFAPILAQALRRRD